MNKLAIFDCDGTLVDSQGPIFDAMEHAFAASSLTPPSREATRRITGLSLFEAMRSLHPHGEETHHVRMVEDFKNAFQELRRTTDVHEPLYDGIVDILDALDGAGWLLGVATGKSDRGLNFVLGNHGLTERFVTLHTADRHPSKPHPSMIEACITDAGAAPETAAMIGDTSFDMTMAKAAGIMAIGVSWGYHGPDELREAGADIVIDHPSDIAPALKELP
ncbi:MAG: HAD-IA family hydrolase [Sphingomonadaceae bacterium]|nr:HAD-IA family hydrolase [Sphingomonadaceae bacterium]